MAKGIIRSPAFNFGSLGLFGLSAVLSQMHFPSGLITVALALSLLMIAAHAIKWTYDFMQGRSGPRSVKQMVMALAIIAVVAGGIATFLALTQTQNAVPPPVTTTADSASSVLKNAGLMRGNEIDIKAKGYDEIIHTTETGTTEDNRINMDAEK